MTGRTLFPYEKSDRQEYPDRCEFLQVVGQTAERDPTPPLAVALDSQD